MPQVAVRPASVTGWKYELTFWVLLGTWRCRLERPEEAFNSHLSVSY